MLFSAEGHQLGMLSGGCLESDIHHHARRVMLNQTSLTLSYDGSDEDDMAFQLGIGCGGTVHILLQPVCHLNAYLQLESMLSHLKQYHPGHYYQKVTTDGEVATHFEPGSDKVSDISQAATLLHQKDGLWLHNPISPPTHILLVGGGIDARPMASLAHQLGWHVSLWDPRPANGRAEYFPHIKHRLKVNANELASFIAQQGVRAAILMSHNVTLDADALAGLASVRLDYLALLGPLNRRNKVLNQAGLVESQLLVALAGPAGLDIGGDLPENIALAILSECQAALNGRSAASLSQILTPPATDTKPIEMTHFHHAKTYHLSK